MEAQQHTVAIVDDDPRVQKALSRLLSQRGYRATAFASPADFFRAAPASDAACLIIDLRVGDTSGLELARQLAADGFEFPTIFLSSSDDDLVRIRCHELNCVAYLHKPCPEGLLLQAIAQAIGSNTKLA